MCRFFWLRIFVTSIRLILQSGGNILSRHTPHSTLNRQTTCWPNAIEMTTTIAHHPSAIHPMQCHSIKWISYFYCGFYLFSFALCRLANKLTKFVWQFSIENQHLAERWVSAIRHGTQINLQSGAASSMARSH